MRQVVVTTAEEESDSEPPELIDESTDSSSSESEDSDSDLDNDEEALASKARVEGKKTVPDYSLRPGTFPKPLPLPETLPKLPKAKPTKAEKEKKT